MAEKAQQDPQCSWFFTGVTVFWELTHILFYKTVLCNCKNIFFHPAVSWELRCYVFFWILCVIRRMCKHSLIFAMAMLRNLGYTHPFVDEIRERVKIMNYLVVHWMAFWIEISHVLLISILLTFSLQSMASGREARSTSDWKTAPEPWLSLISE